MIQSVSFTSAAFEDFAEANLWFLVSALTKKNNNKNKLKDLLLFIFRYTYSYRCCDSHFLGFGQYIFPNFRLALIWFCLLVVLKALAI